MALTFDAASKRIIISGSNQLDVVDCYSRWKDFARTADNSKYPPAFAVTGGDAIDPVAGTRVPCYAFLTNGWRVRPMEASHTLAVTGGVLLVDGGGDPFVNTVGSYVVRINYQQPVQAITVTTGGGGSAPDPLAAIIEGTLTTADVLRIILAVTAGKSIVSPDGIEIKFRDSQNLVDRVSAVCDAAGARQAVVLNPA
jgi:hypothetical protein